MEVNGIVEPVTSVLGGVAVSVISLSIGRYLGDKGRVSESQCTKSQIACSNLIVEKIDNLTSKVNDLKTTLDANIINQSFHKTV